MALGDTETHMPLENHKVMRVMGSPARLIDRSDVGPRFARFSLKMEDHVGYRGERPQAAVAP